MSKVEELREDIHRRLFAIPRGDYGIIAGLKTLNIEDQIDSLIAAAREEGKGELQAIFDMLWKRMRTWEAEWRSENPKERALTSPDSIQLMEWKIAKARAEGAEQERERLRSSALTSWCGRSDEYGDMLMMPASLLAPTEPEVKP